MTKDKYFGKRTKKPTFFAIARDMEYTIQSMKLTFIEQSDVRFENAKGVGWLKCDIYKDPKGAFYANPISDALKYTFYRVYTKPVFKGLA